VNNDGNQSYRSYLRFDVAGLTGDVTNARLRLFVTDASSVGGSVHPVSAAWTETSVTWSTAPAFGSALDTAGPAVAGEWIELNVTSLVAGNGTYDFALTSTSSNSAIFSSREGAQPPELLITRSGGEAQPLPVASFIAAPLSGTAPLAVDFTDTSTGPASTWAWDFHADGTVDSTAERPIHIYREPGQYSVRLTVGNGSGTDSVVRDALITVAPGPVASPDDPVMVGAGDIAGCSVLGDEATAAIIDGIAGTVFTTGDNVYDDGTAEEFANCYHPSWGRHLARTRPTVGNHEYRTANAGPYFEYFGAAAGRPGEGWYSYDLGGWHVVVLNSNCTDIGGCGAGSAQDAWLQADLAASDASCTVALWHHPRFSSGHHGNEASMAYFWSLLEAEGTELALVGHDHNYERFAAQTSTGVASSAGIREIVVGTGGKSLSPLLAAKPNSEVRDSSTAGVLKLTLHAAGYSWEFLPATTGGFVDAGSDTCH
jgi:PKD repeat protein